MPRYIDADRLIKAIRQDVCSTCAVDDKEPCVCNYEDCIIYIEDCPTADVQEVKHGQWIKYYDGIESACSICFCRSGIQYDGLEMVAKETRFCPSCGAKMDKEVKDNV